MCLLTGFALFSWLLHCDHSATESLQQILVNLNREPLRAISHFRSSEIVFDLSVAADEGID